MSFLKRILGKPGSLQCSYCSRAIEPPQFGAFSMDKAVEHALKVGYYCDRCRKIACAECSFDAAKAQGVGYFICPSCGKNIAEDYADENSLIKMSSAKVRVNSQPKKKTQTPKRTPAPVPTAKKTLKQDQVLPAGYLEMKEVGTDGFSFQDADIQKYPALSLARRDPDAISPHLLDNLRSTYPILVRDGSKPKVALYIRISSDSLAAPVTDTTPLSLHIEAHRVMDIDVYSIYPLIWNLVDDPVYAEYFILPYDVSDPSDNDLARPIYAGYLWRKLLYLLSGDGVELIGIDDDDKVILTREITYTKAQKRVYHEIAKNLSAYHGKRIDFKVYSPQKVIGEYRGLVPLDQIEKRFDQKLGGYSTLIDESFFAAVEKETEDPSDLAVEESQPDQDPLGEILEPEMILIPRGEFIMGGDPKKDSLVTEYEQPVQYHFLPDYYIAKTPVTVNQYQAFLKATNHHMPYHWQTDGIPRPEAGNLPITNISIDDAFAYCEWLTRETGRQYRLPTEAEWEKAARGSDGRIFPWGDEWDPSKCNSYASRQGDQMPDLKPVDAFPNGASPYGLLDMVGNTFEYTQTIWGKDYGTPEFRYPYNPEDGRENLEGDSEVYRVLRSGGRNVELPKTRCAWRAPGGSKISNPGASFRVVAPLPVSEEDRQLIRKLVRLFEREQDQSQQTQQGGRNDMSNEAMITQYLGQLGAPASPFADLPGGAGVRSTIATYMGLQVDILVLQDQYLIAQFAIGYAPRVNAEMLLRQLMVINSTMIGVYFCVFNANNAIMLRTTRIIEGLDFIEFKQSLDTLCAAFMQHGRSVAQTFQIPQQPT